MEPKEILNNSGYTKQALHKNTERLILREFESSPAREGDPGEAKSAGTAGCCKVILEAEK